MLHQILLKVKRFVTNIISKWTHFTVHTMMMPLCITLPKKMLFYTHQSHIDEFFRSSLCMHRFFFQFTMSIVGLFTHPARDWAGKYGTSVIAWI
jgi:hypothetical protein